MKKSHLVVALFAITLTTSFAHAAEPERYWDPGNPTTARMKGEVEADRIESNSDGVYGRFESPFELGLHAGADVDRDGAAFAGRASLHYFSMAGVYAGYSDALGGDAFGGSRIVSFGVDARPAFIPRWSKNWEQGSSFLDLTIDSISLGLACYFRTPREESFGNRRGLELSLGFGMPLIAHAAGPWIGARGLLRWEDPGAGDSSAKPSVLVTLGWHFLVGG
jgi:hypothetical protein